MRHFGSLGPCQLAVSSLTPFSHKGSELVKAVARSPRCTAPLHRT